MARSCWTVLWAALCLASTAGAATPATDASPLAKRNPLKVLVFPEVDRPEFFSTDARTPGFEREILEGFVKAHKLNLEVVTVPRWEALVPALTDGKGDIVAGHFTNTEERRKQVDFTQGLLPTRSVIITRKPRPAITTLKQLQAEKIGAIKGSAVLEDLLAAGVPRANIDDTITPNNILDALRAGKVTALVRSVPLAVLSQKDDPDIQLGMFLGGGSHFAFGVRKGDAALLNALDEHIELLNQTGQWNRLVVKYFGANAVDILKKAQQ